MGRGERGPSVSTPGDELGLPSHRDRAPGVRGPSDPALLLLLTTYLSAIHNTNLLMVQKVESAPATGPLRLRFPLPLELFP